MIVVSEQVEEIQVFVEVSNGVSAHKISRSLRICDTYPFITQHENTLIFLKMKLMKCKPVVGVILS